MEIIRANCDLLWELIDIRNIWEVFMALGSHLLVCNWAVEFFFDRPSNNFFFLYQFHKPLFHSFTNRQPMLVN